jgi:hypothetical protein
MDIVFLYYDNPRMLEFQIDCWNLYSNALASGFRILLIDDGSPKIPATEIIKKKQCNFKIEVYRIIEDIDWNFSGARNLGCSMATDWIYVSDIDTMLLPNEAVKFFDGAPLESNHFYMPKRVKYSDAQALRPAVVNLLFHKEKFLEIGGYDEDYAGHYGKEEIDFFRRLRRVAQLVRRNDVLTHVVRPSQIRDANTRGRLRDKSRNTELFDKKLSGGLKNPVDSLRFSWERVI